MAYIQRVSFQEPPKYTFSLSNFAGGINNVSDVRENQARNLLNMAFTDGELMEKRPGIKPITELSRSTTGDVVFLDEYKPYTGSNKFIQCLFDGGVYKIFVDSTHVGDVASKPRGTNFQNKYYLVDGVDIHITDGVTLKKLKNPPPDFTPLPSPATIGQWKEDATHVWYEPCDLELGDSFKGVNLIPVKPTLITSNKGRIFISGCVEDPNNVYISDLENGYYFPPTLPIQPNPNGEVVTALKIFHDVLIVGRNESLFALYGNTNRTDSTESFVFKQINSHTGIYNQETCQLAHDYMFYLGSDGIVYRMITPLTDVRQITSKTLSLELDFFKHPVDLKKTDMATSNSCFWNNEYHLYMGGFIFVYSFTKLAWTIYDNIDSKYMVNLNDTIHFCSTNGSIYTFKEKVVNIITTQLETWDDEEYWVDSEPWSSLLVDINRPYTDTKFDGTKLVCEPIVSFWSSKRYDQGDPTRYKHFREMFIVTSTWRDFISNVSVRFEIDFVDVDNILQVKDSIAVFGRAKWGDRFINKDIAASIPTQIGRRGRYISFTIANDTIDEPLKVHEVAGDYILRGRR